MNANKRYLRWLALVIIIANIAFNNLYMYLLPEVSAVAEISDKYNSLFTPAGYAFAIWGLIFIALLIYGIAQLMPKTRLNATYDKLAVPVIIASILCSVWVIVFQYVGISVIVILATLITAIYMYMQALKCYRSGWTSAWLMVPFSLFAGWISVATIADISLYLKSIGWDGAGISEPLWTIIMISVAALLGIIVSLTTRNYIFPAVVVWALIAIYMKHQSAYQNIAITALISAIIVGVFALAALLRPTLYNKSRVTGHTPSVH